MLQAVQVIHEEKIVHSDLKPANFVLVRGQVKLIDFGIANAIANDTTNIQRDQQVSLQYAQCSSDTNSFQDRVRKLHEPRSHRASRRYASSESGPTIRCLVTWMYLVPDDLRFTSLPTSSHVPQDESHPRRDSRNRLPAIFHTFGTNTDIGVVLATEEIRTYESASAWRRHYEHESLLVSRS